MLREIQVEALLLQITKTVTDMRHMIIVLLVLLLPFTSFSQKASDSTKVNDFFRIIAEKDSSDIGALLTYMSITDAPIPEYKHKLTRDKKIELVKWYAYLWNNQLKEHCNSNYHIYSHKNINPDFLHDFRIQYENKENVYYVVCNNNIIYAAIIIEDGTIISFFSGVIFNHKSVVPVLLY